MKEYLFSIHFHQFVGQINKNFSLAKSWCVINLANLAKICNKFQKQ